MANKRLFYAVYGVGIAQLGTNTFTRIKGLQSITMTTRFNLEQVFEIGQISIYENIEGLPDVELQMERVLDGECPVYIMATRGATSASLSGRSAARSTVAISYFGDTQDSASGVPLRQCTLSGLYPSQVQFQLSVDGNATESLTLVGNNKTWLSSSFTFTGNYWNADSPIGSGGVQRREDILFGSSPETSRLPADIPGISSSGTNNYVNSEYGAHIRSVSVSTNLGRDNLFELGRRGPYHRFANFPTEVRSEFECYSQYGDTVSADEESNTNTTERYIFLKFREGLALNLGTHNRLESVTQSGGQAGGGGSNNMTNTFSYVNFNDLTVTHPNDPSGLS